MIDVTLVSRFAVLVAVLSCIPGPAVLLTVATALRRGSRAGFAAACGVLSGNAFYFVLSGAGVAALLLASYAAFTVLKYVGAAYLAYLGLRALFARRSELGNGAEGDAPVADARRAFRAGLVTQLSNPKALVFFVAIVPQFVDAQRGVAVQIAALTIVSTAVEFAVLAVYVGLATRVRRMPSADRASLWFERVGGAALLLVAATIAREPVGER
jgi:threonine/homoserine/homoserine lactone efflux protein